MSNTVEDCVAYRGIANQALDYSFWRLDKVNDARDRQIYKQ